LPEKFFPRILGGTCPPTLRLLRLWVWWQ